MNVVDLRHLEWGTGINGTSKGLFPKVKSGRYYFKMSAYNMNVGVYGNQSISEVLASRIAHIIGVRCVEYRPVYGLIRLDGREFKTLICVSEEYKKDGETAIPIENYYTAWRGSRGNGSVMEMCEGIGELGNIYKMFVFDYLINNIDRNGRNLEILVGKKGKISLSPLFDNGLSLFSTKADHELDSYLDRDDLTVNNFIGEMNLRRNLEYIDKKIVLNRIKEEHREYLFRDLREFISKEREEFIWRRVWRRFNETRKIPYISWR